MMSDINVTPFVDVMLVLLIIFMVTAPLMATGLELDLPRVDAPPIEDPDEAILIRIDNEGRYYIQDRQFTISELATKLPAIAKENPERHYHLEADGDVPYRRVARLLSICMEAGIPSLGFRTQPGGVEGEEGEEDEP